MRVLCIDGNCICEKTVIVLVKGNIYTVIDTTELKKHNSKGRFVVDGTYYKLIETGHWYHCSLFVQINETQQDETEMQRNIYTIKQLK